jgi:hypothetical protein
VPGDPSPLVQVNPDETGPELLVETLNFTLLCIKYLLELVQGSNSTYVTPADSHELVRAAAAVLLLDL